MPSPSDQSQSATTLPAPELNPLLNPLLAENMGRWAEVYFTSPPERREQAVLELLRELEAKKNADDVAPGRQRDTQPRITVPQAVEPAPDDLLPPQTPILHCEACGRDNPASHKFCGMCGALLKRDRWGTHRSEGLPPAERFEEEENPRSENEPSYNYSPTNDNGLSLFQRVGGGHYGDASDWEYEPASSPSYRIYIGLALAVVIAALGYVAWRGAQASQTSQGPPPAPPAATREVEPTAAAPKTESEPPQAPPSSQSSPRDASQPAKRAEEPGPAPASEPTRSERNNQAARRTDLGETNTQENRYTGTATPTSSDNGSEELAVAQRYLSGVSGQRRDGAEAAKWLWKSIAKQNSEATLLLADLYLKGDGVSKNCDQARVLLYSAARKGVSGAGERLRNLQAFGCQ